MNLIDEALACLKPAVPAGTRLIVFGSRRAAMRGKTATSTCWWWSRMCPTASRKWRGCHLLGRRLIPADVVVMSADTFERQKTMINTWLGARRGQAGE